MPQRIKRRSYENLSGWRLTDGKLLLITPHGEEEFKIASISFTEVRFRYRECIYAFELGDVYTTQRQLSNEPRLHFTVYRVLRRLAMNLMQSLFRGARRPLTRPDIFIRVMGYKVLLRATHNGLLVVKHDGMQFVFSRSDEYLYTQVKAPYGHLPEGLAVQLRLFGFLIWQTVEQYEIDPVRATDIARRIEETKNRPRKFRGDLRGYISGNLFGSLPIQRNPALRVQHAARAARRHRKR